MKRKIYFVLLCMASMFTSNAQICNEPLRFSEVPFFTDNQIGSIINQTYGNAIDWLGNSEALTMNAFFPKTSVDTMPLRPGIILIHGGGFTGGNKESWNATAKEFAKRGFVAVTIDYRLGHNCATDSLSYDEAVYRAMQDAHASIRFAVANANLIRMDTNWLFIGGSSAGAATSLAMVYLSQTEWNNTRPNVASQLGNINNSGNNLTNTFTLKGIFNNWGPVGKDFFQPLEMVPTIAFQGDSDPTVDIDSAFSGSCFDPLLVYGPRMIHNQLINNGVCSELTVKIGGGHGVYFNSTTADIFRVGRASCFFKSVMCGSCVNLYTTDSIPAICSSSMTGLSNVIQTKPVIYPNPFTDQLNYNYTSGKEHFTLYSSLGEIIYVGDEIHKQDFSTLPSGIFMVQIVDGKKRYFSKLIKQ